MTESAAVVAKTLATAAQYNNLRNDVLSVTLGHIHDNTAGRAPDDNEKAVFGTGADASVLYDGTNLLIRPRDVGSGNLVVDDEAELWIGPAAASGNQDHGSATTALIINQEASDDLILVLKSSDIATVLTTAVTPNAETDDFFSISKSSATLGGVNIRALAEDGAIANPMLMTVVGGTANTAKTTSASGLFEIQTFEHDGANALANITADGNVFAIKARVGGSDVTRFLVDEDGDFYSVTAGQTFDDFDDLALLDTYDAVRSGNLKGSIKAEHGKWSEYNEQSLIEAGMLGGPVADGGLTNWTQTTRVAIGALRQVRRENRELRQCQNAMMRELQEIKRGLNA